MCGVGLRSTLQIKCHGRSVNFKCGSILFSSYFIPLVSRRPLVALLVGRDPRLLVGTSLLIIHTVSSTLSTLWCKIHLSVFRIGDCRVAGMSGNKKC